MSKPASKASSASMTSATGKSSQPANLQRSSTTGSSSFTSGLTSSGSNSTSSPRRSYDVGDYTDSQTTEASSATQLKHERILGLLYDNILEPAFQSMLHDFVSKYCRYFADPKAAQPNWPKLFQEYEQMGRDYLEARIQRSEPNFSLRAFSAQLQQQLETPSSAASSGDGDDALALMEVADILQSFVDYEYFKHHMADHFDSYYSGEQDLSGLVTVTPITK